MLRTTSGSRYLLATSTCPTTVSAGDRCHIGWREMATGHMLWTHLSVPGSRPESVLWNRLCIPSALPWTCLLIPQRTSSFKTVGLTAPLCPLYTMSGQGPE